MWYEKYDADEYLNKQEAQHFLSEVITDFNDRRQSDIELKVSIFVESSVETKTLSLFCFQWQLS